MGSTLVVMVSEPQATHNEDTDSTQSEYDHFTELARKLVQVPKEEVKKQRTKGNGKK